MSSSRVEKGTFGESAFLRGPAGELMQLTLAASCMGWSNGPAAVTVLPQQRYVEWQRALTPRMTTTHTVPIAGSG